VFQEKRWKLPVLLKVKLSMDILSLLLYSVCQINKSLLGWKEWRSRWGLLGRNTERKEIDGDCH
jgi:hypothetical protein